jgi:hypothetical protein
MTELKTYYKKVVKAEEIKGVPYTNGLFVIDKCDGTSASVDIYDCESGLLVASCPTLMDVGLVVSKNSSAISKLRKSVSYKETVKELKKLIPGGTVTSRKPRAKKLKADTATEHTTAKTLTPEPEPTGDGADMKKDTNMVKAIVVNNNTKK